MENVTVMFVDEEYKKLLVFYKYCRHSKKKERLKRRIKQKEEKMTVGNVQSIGLRDLNHRNIQELGSFSTTLPIPAAAETSLFKRMINFFRREK
jgi:hypothetical protein